MKITGKPIMIGVPAVMVTVLIAVMAMWAWGPLGGAGDGVGATAQIMGTVEYTVFGADGKIKDQGIGHNAVTVPFLSSARGVLGVDFDLNGASDDALYNAIELCAIPTTVDATVCTTLSSAAAIDEDNPQNGVGVNVSTDAYSVTLTFTATGAVTIEGFHLCGVTAQIDTQVCEVGEIGAFQNTGTITLAATDTIQVVWTITFVVA